MKRLSLRRAIVALAISAALPVMIGSSGCKKPKPVEDAAPPTTPAAEEDVVNIAPIEEPDASDGGDGEAGKKYGTGGSAVGNRIRACCGSIGAVLSNPLLKNTPEGQAAKGYLGQCYAAATAVDKNPNAPEVAQLRAMLAGKPFPGCGGF